MKQPDETAVMFKQKHNHMVCINHAMQTAEALCSENGARFTGIRRQVLELVWSNHQPVTAYNLLKKLRQEKDNAEPPTVYRALDFLLDNGLVHKIESLNAFVGCDRPHRSHTGQFMICSSCLQVAELDEGTMISKAIDRQASVIGFKVANKTVEITGLCPSCQ